MNIKRLLLEGACIVASSLSGVAVAQTPSQFVRLAQLVVKTAQLENFKAATKEVGQTSVRAEPGCIALYAVSEKDHPARVTVFEIYRDEEAYKAHLQTPHFKKFRETTDHMVKSRNLLDTIPFSLAEKPR